MPRRRRPCITHRRRPPFITRRQWFMRRLRWSSAAVIMDGRIGVAAGITADTDIAAVMVEATVADMVGWRH